ncbi:UDP-N-acetylmuramoyl-L-alanyl-D-glutamate--2,6-diaminopimelate ligase [Glaciimonas soli]|uniref:UDP-N-acetylmuramoyl-L-alanyl-D-glutamate--2,6-diaminopimelate ligase n=1 Tax=Glaciimonas soli TaxID=2590999 RepID=A0A843YRT3_9BURK|nr:UDP-N-acetylmuramoyl-L-alanyl-D-glutamate--2,6-diaminopimelate ligase [Glaciimonas soli]MQR02265.1 UDP-N-acetylmuramoyl-L-alanyl-D-glutamate--2,6-diaminopimelate ligase [Glaciimonas soli]
MTTAKQLQIQLHPAVDFLRGFASANLTSDSRKVKPGDVFFAYQGDATDGRLYIAQAVQNGAAAVLYDDEAFTWKHAWGVPSFAVYGLKRKAGAIANAFYQQPDKAMTVIAVTGTNGKTSCSQWLGRALSLLDEPTGVVGTLGIGIFAQGQDVQFDATGYTTPDAVLMQSTLAAMEKKGIQALAMEASSIGLEQGRMDGMHIDIALFTNFTRDHLDYHGTEENYEAAKRILFDWPDLQHAVINLDDAMGLRLARHLKNRATSVIGYTVSDGKDSVLSDDAALPILRASAIRTSASGTVFHLASPFGQGQIKIQMVGQFNVSNVLGILGVLWAKGVQWDAAIAAIEQLTAVPGRMQQFGGDEAPLVVIDYAHTPDALEKTLLTLRQVAEQRGGELWCVFGCGGDRDPGKRPQMGAIAELADHVVVTSDNPRSEEPATIIEQILKGMKTGAKIQTQGDRAGAILRAVTQANKNDVVLLAGKGHETYQEIKGKKYPFLDADHAALALASRVMKGGVL